MNLAFAAGDRLGNADISCIGLSHKYLIGKQTARNVAGAGSDVNFSGVRTVNLSLLRIFCKEGLSVIE